MAQLSTLVITSFEFNLKKENHWKIIDLVTYNLYFLLQTIEDEEKLKISNFL